MNRPVIQSAAQAAKSSDAAAGDPSVLSSSTANGTAVSDAATPARKVSLPRRLLRKFSVLGLIGLFIVTFWIVIACIGPAIAPHSGGALTSNDVFGSYSAAYPLGTDYLGRDMLSRIIFGTRYTVGLALAAAVLASVIGTAFGLFSAVSNRWIDECLSRFFDALVSIPSKILALVLIAAFGSSSTMLILVAALAYLPGAFRISRSLAVNLMMLEYVQVSRARGEKLLYIACREILPNMLQPMLADFGLRFVYIVLLLSALSFLGLGVQPPDADWGSLVRENIGGLSFGAPAVLMPAIAIATLTVGMNLLIDSLRRKGQRGAQ